MKYKIFNKTKSVYIALEAEEAVTFFERLLGLMFRSSMAKEEALIFRKVNSIHMFFMKFPIDVLYLDKANKVLKIKHCLKPWRMSSCMRARVTIELPAKKAVETATEAGDTLEFIEELS